MKKETAVFAMGCFWQPDSLFSKIPGVIETAVGYIGGNEEYYPKPTYNQVCSGDTGYAEAVKIIFDSKKISYKKLLEIFWNNHNPTTLNRQGPDVGAQYRSAIFYTTEKQKKEAEESKKEKQKTLKNKIVTEITKASTFFPAEEYHQKYLEKRGLASCRI
mgnify:CR=1 FL=1